MYNVYNISCTGSGHMKRGVVCQDYSGSYSGNHVKIVAVADGHGSKQYFRSDRGSKFAVEAAIDCLKGFAESSVDSEFGDEPFDEQNESDLMNQLIRSILIQWYSRVDDDIQADPLREEELTGLDEKYVNRYKSGNYLSMYGSTLIAALMTEKYWLAVQIGDGKFVCIDENGRCTQPIPWDEECQFNVCTSICQPDAEQRFRYHISTEMPLALCFGSDGVDDSYGDGELLYTFYKQLVMEFYRNGYAQTAKNIETDLPNVSARGSHDDITVGMIFQTDVSHELITRFSNEIEYSRLKNELSLLYDKQKISNKRFHVLSEKKAEHDRNFHHIQDDITYYLQQINKSQATLRESIQRITDINTLLECEELHEFKYNDCTEENAIQYCEEMTETIEKLLKNTSVQVSQHKAKLKHLERLRNYIRKFRESFERAEKEKCQYETDGFIEEWQAAERINNDMNTAVNEKKARLKELEELLDSSEQVKEKRCGAEMPISFQAVSMEEQN